MTCVPCCGWRKDARRRRVVERSFARAARFHRLARDDERLPITLAGCHCLVFAILMLRRVAELMAQGA
jgi:hypothetical protein